MSNLNEIRVKSFFDLKLKNSIKKGVFINAMYYCSKIQSITLIPLLKGRDIIYQSPSGTGKTTCYIIGTSNQLCQSINSPQCLILVPTRELSIQIRNVFNVLNIYTKNSITSCHGGRWLGEDLKNLKKNFHGIVGTPGRVLHLLQIGSLAITKIRTFVLDEADILMNKNFKIDIFNIYRYLNSKVQIIICSATIPLYTLQAASKFLLDPVMILMRKEEINIDKIKQFYISVFIEENKLLALLDIFETLLVGQVLIFCNTIRKANWIHNKLLANNFNVGLIHGRVIQKERTNIFKNFRDGKTRALVTTDVSSRGLNIPEVSLVINYDIPTFKDVYLHRIGRTGRFGRQGVAINFAKLRDLHNIKNLEVHFSITIEELKSELLNYKY